MFDVDFFLRGLKAQVAQLGAPAIVRLLLHSGTECYVRDVVETHAGYVLLNIYHGNQGRPIVASSSSAYSEDTPIGYHPQAVAFESIARVEVLPTTEEDRRRIGFNT